MNSKWLGGERQYFIQKKVCGDFSGGPAAKNPPSHGGGTKIPHAVKQLSNPPPLHLLSPCSETKNLCMATETQPSLKEKQKSMKDNRLPGGSAGQESTCNARDPSSSPGLGRFPGRRDRLPTPIFLGFPGGSDSKESTGNMRDVASIHRLRRSLGGGHGNPLQHSCLENPHGQRSLAGYSPWDRKGSDTTERLTHMKKKLSVMWA